MPPWGTLLLLIWCSPRTRTTAFTAKWHSVSPKSSKCNISISNGPIVFKFYTEVKYLKLHTKLSMTRLTPKLHSFMTFLYPPSLLSNGSIAFKFYTDVKYLKLHIKKLSMTRLTPKLHSWWHFCIPQFFEMQYLHE